MHEGLQQQTQQKGEPGQQAAEVVSRSGEDGVDSVAVAAGQEVPVHAVVFLAMADDRLDAGAAFELPPDGGGDAAFLALSVDLELVFFRGVMAFVSGVGEDARQGRAGDRFDCREERF